MVIGLDFSEDTRAAGELAMMIGRCYGVQDPLVRVYPNIVHWAELAEGQRELYEQLIDDLLDNEKRVLEERAAGRRL